MTYFILTILGIIAGAIIIYFILKPKLKTVQTLDLQTLQQNQQAKEELSDLTHQHSTLSARIEEMNKSFSVLQKQTEEAAKSLYEHSLAVANEKMSTAAEELSEKYNKAKEQAKSDYLIALQEYQNIFKKEFSIQQEEYERAVARLADLTDKVNTAVEAAKRQEELKNEKDFYKLNLSEEDLFEIQQLRDVAKYLRNSEPLNKVIWKVYYENPYNELAGRVIGNGRHIGIYKITHIDSQRCYVGQSVDLISRWRQHIKRGIGAETPTRNKLYPAMLKYGVENFTFEIIEECDKSLLDEREDYWQQYFHALDFGYSIK